MVAQICQKPRIHPKIPGARMVTWSKVPYRGFTAVGYHGKKI